MQNKKIECGHRVGRLTVVEATGERRSGYTVWRCRCDCGGEILLDTRYLKRETVQDCGCGAKTNPRQKNLAGMRFGRLVAVEPTSERSGKGSTVWKCRCDCGGEVLASVTQLTRGDRRSCGCEAHGELKDYVGARFSSLTVLEYAGKRGKVHQWKCRCDCGKETVVSQSNLQSGWTKSCGCLRSQSMKDSLGCVDGTSVAALVKSREKLLPGNRSGCAGVYRHQNGKWIAQITFKGKTYYLGCYAGKEDAISARKRGEEMHDEFLRWYYLEYMGLEKLPDGVQKMIGV